MTTYKESGVDIDAGNKLVTDISERVKATYTKGCLDSFGGFGGGFELPTGFKQPVLISGTDGVGTKLRLAIQTNNFDTIGQDLVAMCYNDVLCSGAMPLYFLDYYATSKLRSDMAAKVITSICDACLIANIALIGGETAEMPSVFNPNEFDIAGFCTGIVEKELIIDGSTIMAGDTLIALPSSGLHSNGFSLINKIIKDHKLTPSSSFMLIPDNEYEIDETKGIHYNDFNVNLFEYLLTPTRIYTEVFDLINTPEMHILGISHITGGGVIENLPRMIPDYANLKLELKKWEFPEIFKWIQKTDNISREEMLRVFNCGVGMILCVSNESVDPVLNQIKDSWIIGTVKNARENEEKICFID